MIKKILLIIGFAILVIFMFSEIHEVTHYQIGKYYGCQGTIEWDFLDINKTIAEFSQGEQTAFMSTHWDSNCKSSESQALAHSINEIIGYNIMTILEIFLVFLFTFMVLNSREKNNINVVDIK